MTTAICIFSPKPYVLVHDWDNFESFVSLADYRAKHGRTKAQMLPFVRQPSLRFSTVESPCAIRMERDSFGQSQHAITGKGLVQLMKFYAMTVTVKGEPLIFEERVLAKFFEGEDLSLATAFSEKLKFIIDPTLPAAPDNASRHAALAARETNGTTWKRLGAIPQGEALPEPKSLPLDGRYSIPEMVAHDRQTGILARAMLARMNGQD